MKKLSIGIVSLFLAINAFAAPDEFSMGKVFGYPVCPFYNNNGCKVGSFSTPPNSPTVRTGTEVLPLTRTTEFGDTAYISDYFSKQKAMALLVLKKDKIVYEDYQYDRTQDNLFRGFSMSKTIVGMLVGIAHDRGYIKSLDDTADMYFKEISGTAYGSTTVRNLLRMRSGISFSEDGGDRNFYWQTMNSNRSDAMVSLANRFNTRSYPQGTKLNYSTLETEVLARVLIRATGKNLTQLTEEWLWIPMGAETPGRWIVFNSDKLEMGGGGFYATLRDWGRLGLLLANNGRVGNRQIIPEKFVIEATSMDEHPRHKIGAMGYGYQTWIYPVKPRSFALFGIYGQGVVVHTEAGIVMVQMSVYDKEVQDAHQFSRWEFMKKLFPALGGRIEHAP